ncbi:putative lipid II flippase FtsW [Breznakiellaceae bacterium SP9]
MASYIHIEKTGRPLQIDHILSASILLLTGLGLVTLYSSSYAYAERVFGNGLYLFSRQLVLGLIGIVFYFVACRINITLLRRFIKPLVLFSALLCVLTFFPGIGVEKNGASRWISIAGYTYQPSELVKLVLPIYLAHIFDKKQESLNEVKVGLLPPFLLTILFFTLIYLQNNFSTAMLLAINALFVFYLAGVQRRFFVGTLVVLIPLSILLVLTREHRFRRLFSYFFPDWEPQGAGFQVRASLLTIMSGGFLGKGLGNGTRKIASVPEIHSDFIFASYSEEWGLAGVLFCIILFTVFAVQGFRAALRQNEPYPRLLSAGLVCSIVSQTLLNIAVVAGALPTTGIPLPFFSAGGSSLATTLLTAGLIVNVSRTAASKEEDFVR